MISSTGPNRQSHVLIALCVQIQMNFASLFSLTVHIRYRSNADAPDKNNVYVSALDTLAFFQSWSTLLNLLASVGSWRMISSEEKMGSRYNHVLWQLIHSSTSPCAYLRRNSHASPDATEGGIVRGHHGSDE